MKNFILVLDVICILLTAIVGINTILYLKKNENIEIDTIRKGLNIRIKLLEILVILLTILTVLVNIDNILKIF